MVKDGILYTKDGKTLCNYPTGKMNDSFTIPDGVTEIAASAFAKCGSLKTVKIPPSVIKIGENAFYDCVLDDLSIPNSVTKIADDVFYNCILPEKFTIPEGVTSIGNFAFSWCRTLKSITIPASVKKIGQGALSDCAALRTIRYKGTMADWNAVELGNDWLNDTPQIKKINCKNGNVGLFNRLTTKGDTLTDCTKEAAGTVVIPDGITEIKRGAFWDCKLIDTIEIPKSVTKIDFFGFNRCKALKKIRYGGTVAEWNAVELAEKWINETPKVTKILCTDGDGEVFHQLSAKTEKPVESSTKVTENNKGRAADGGIRGWHNTLTPEEAAEFWKNL